MSPIFRDLHPTRASCRGIKCTTDMTCDICKDWSVVLWEAFLKRCPYSGCCKKCPSGSILPPVSQTPPPSASASSEAGKPEALRFPLSHSPLLLRGVTVQGMWRMSFVWVLARSPLPPLSLLWEGGGEHREGLGFCRHGRFGCFLPPVGGSSGIIALTGVPCAR